MLKYSMIKYGMVKYRILTYLLWYGMETKTNFIPYQNRSAHRSIEAWKRGSKQVSIHIHPIHDMHAYMHAYIPIPIPGFVHAVVLRFALPPST